MAGKRIRGLTATTTVADTDVLAIDNSTLSEAAKITKANFLSAERADILLRELESNKTTVLSAPNDITFPTTKAVVDILGNSSLTTIAPKATDAINEIKAEIVAISIVNANAEVVEARSSAVKSEIFATLDARLEDSEQNTLDLETMVANSNISTVKNKTFATLDARLEESETDLFQSIKDIHIQSVGSTTVFTVAITGIASYVDGYDFLFFSRLTSTGDCYIEINALGAKFLYKKDKVTRATTGDIVISTIYYVKYFSSINGFAIQDLTPNIMQYNSFFRKEGTSASPNIINGHPGNAISKASYGCIISGSGNIGRENVIGGVIANVGTANSNGIPIDDTFVVDYSRIIGGYDNVINGESGTINADHCSIEEAATHAAINGGANHKIIDGDYNVIGGGVDNTLSADFGVVAGGARNVMQSAGAGGVIAGGADNNLSGIYSGVGYGRYNQAIANYSSANGVYGVSTSKGKQVTGGGRFSAAGDAQCGKLICRKQTTDATPAFCGFEAAYDVLVMPDNSSWYFDVKIIARRGANGESKAWHVTFMGINNAGASTTIVNKVITVVGEQPTGTDAWTVDFVSDTDSVDPIVTGEAGKTINWVMVIETVEVVA